MTWIIHPEFGFFSIVQARAGNGELGQPPDPNRLMVRARLVADLERLKAAFPQLREIRILTSLSADYPARILVGRSVWAEVAAGLVMDHLGYLNAKAEAAAKRGPGDSLVEAMHAIWSVLRRIELPRTWRASHVQDQQGDQ